MDHFFQLKRKYFFQAFGGFQFPRLGIALMILCSYLVASAHVSQAGSSDETEAERALVDFHQKALNGYDLTTKLELPTDYTPTQMLADARLVIALGKDVVAVLSGFNSEIGVKVVEVASKASAISSVGEHAIKAVIRAEQGDKLGAAGEAGDFALGYTASQVPVLRSMWAVYKDVDARTSAWENTNENLIEKARNIAQILQLEDLRTQIEVVEEKIGQVQNLEKRQEYQQALERMVQRKAMTAAYEQCINEYISSSINYAASIVSQGIHHSNEETPMLFNQFQELVRSYVRGNINKEQLNEGIENLLRKWDRVPSSQEELNRTANNIIDALGTKVEKARQSIQQIQQIADSGFVNALGSDYNYIKLSTNAGLSFDLRGRGYSGTSATPEASNDYANKYYASKVSIQDFFGISPTVDLGDPQAILRASNMNVVANWEILSDKYQEEMKKGSISHTVRVEKKKSDGNLSKPQTNYSSKSDTSLRTREKVQNYEKGKQRGNIKSQGAPDNSNENLYRYYKGLYSNIYNNYKNSMDRLRENFLRAGKGQEWQNKFGKSYQQNLQNFDPKQVDSWKIFQKSSSGPSYSPPSSSKKK